MWAAGFLGHVALLLVLLVRGRWRTFPIFTALIGFNVFRTILLFFIYKYADTGTYAVVYWIASYLDLALQVGIVYEMARVVLKPTGSWVRDAKKTFLLLGLAGAIIAVAIAYTMHPSSSDPFELWQERGNLFSVMLTLELFVSMALVSNQLGLVWGNHVMRLGQGWAIWALVDLIAEGALSHFGEDSKWHGLTWDNIRILTYILVTIYWTVTMWIPEPKRRTLSPEMQNYLQNLHEQLQAELQSVSSTKKH